MSTIKLSQKHGVNPSLGVCYFCNKENREVILPGLLKGDVEAPRKAVWHKQPCEECKGWMAKGVIFISVKDGESGENPYRTGGWTVIKDEAVERMKQNVNKHSIDDVLEKRVCFLEDTAWDMLGFPRHEVKPDESADLHT